MQKEAIVFRGDAPPDYGPVVFERELPSEPNLIPALILRLVSFLLDVGFADESQRSSLTLCLDEALKNAVIHGNNLVASRKVCVKVHRGSDNFWIVITDEGQGFDLAVVQDPLNDGGVWLEGGRGIHLMQYYSKKIEFWDNGSTIALSFQRASTGGAGCSGGCGEEGV